MKKLILIIIAVVMHVTYSFGQDAITPLNEDIIGPQPATAQYERFETPQPSLATGTVNVPVNLYTVKADDVEIPVSLCYNTQGIKVYDDPYPCGYGWSLLPSLRVTRTVMGRADERYKKLDVSRLPLVGNDNDTLYYCVKDDNGAIPDSDCYDTQHDLFNVSFPGCSFGFMLDKQNDNYVALVAQKNGYKIDADTDLTRFVITDPQGNLWHFGGGNTEQAFESSVVTAWGLEKVQTYKGDSIVVTWDKRSHLGLSTFAPAEYIDYDEGSNEHIKYSDPVDRASIITSRASNQNLHLASISFPGGRLVADYMQDYNSPMLTDLIVVSNDGDTLRHVCLSYSGPAQKNTLLSRIYIEGQGEYRFEYNEVDFHNNKFALDYWGYYNGHTDNGSAIPQITLKSKTTTGDTYVTIPVNGENSADRSVDESAMQANMLRKVTLPSGGEVSFTYETHRFPAWVDTTAWITNNPVLTFGGGLRVSEISTKESPSAEPIVTRYAYGDHEDGLAECIALPTLTTFVTAREGLTLCNGPEESGPRFTTCRTLDISNESQYMRNHMGETPIWYKTVTVYYGGGKTVHQFCDIVPANGTRNEWQANNPYNSINDLTSLSHAFSAGIVQTAVTEYRGLENGDYTPVKEIRNSYSASQNNPLRQIVDFAVKRTKIDRGLGMFSPDIREDSNGEIWTDYSSHHHNPFRDEQNLYYAFQQYPVLFITERLDSVTTTEYTSNGAITDITAYSYSSDYDFVREVRKYRNGHLYESEVREYPFALSQIADVNQQQAIASLVASNRISEPCAVTVCDAAQGVRSRIKTEYSISHGLSLPARIVQDCGGNRDFELKSFAYDHHHNVTDIAYDNNSRREAYVWDNDGLYPVAAFAGTSSAEALSLFGNGLSANSSEQLWNRIALNGENSMFSTFLYKKLFGLASTTSFNGVTSSYLYDACGRLSETKIGNETTNAYEYAIGHGEENTFIKSKSFTQADASSYIYNLIHYDGLFRPVRTISGNNGDFNYLAALNEYDSWGRLSKQWNPVSIACGEYASATSLKNAAVSTYGNDAYPYSLLSYIDAPTDSVIQRTGQGYNWHVNNMSQHTLTNTNQASGPLMCRRYSVSANGLDLSGNWQPGDLRVVTTVDEDGKKTSTFTDSEGRVVLSRQDDYADTYYVYDSKGLLRYVLPPEAASRLERQSENQSDIITSLCYVYTYDDLNRCVSKKLPGCAPVYMRYDAGGRVCITQDGNQRSTGKWTVVLRDKHGRTVVTAVAAISHPDACSNVLFRADYTGNGGMEGYSLGDDLSSVIGNYEIMSVYYYDNYDYLSNAVRDSVSYRDLSGYDSRYVSPVAPSQSAKGMVTGKMTRVLNTPNSLLSSMYYDHHGNVIQTHEQNLLGGYEHYYYHLSFTGKPLEVRHEHTTADTINVEILRYTYDNMERLLTTSVERDGAEPVLLCSNTYDELGRLATQSLGGTAEGSHAEALAYAYNVRGWTTGITGTNFSQTLHYEDAGENASYNGNIGSVEWSAKELIDETTRVSQQYNYTYDGLNRLVSAAYSAPGASDWDNTFIANNPRDYSSSYTYDLNGNLTAIKRKGISGKVNVFDYTVVSFGDIDDLSLEYNGNQLKKVTDQCDNLTYEGAMEFHNKENRGDEYTYDANGNMTCDRNKGIQSITYNMLNLPQSVMFDDGHEMRYTYAADGRKLKVEYLLNNMSFVEDITPIGPPFGGGINPLSLDDAIELPIDTASISVTPLIQTLMVRDYCGNHIYRNSALERVLNDVGYADSIGYHYQVKDYRGDVRAVVTQNGTLEETNCYYPYGMLHGTSAIASTQPYKYTGKELDRENGLDWYDFEARMLMSDLGRTTSIDPKSEKYYPISPYAWCAGNPIVNVDLRGERPTPYESALMSKHVYGDNVTLAGGWVLQQRINGEADLNAALYMRTVDGITEYTLAFAGTASIIDAFEDIAQLIGNSQQYKLGVELAEKYSNDLAVFELTFTGHSLGGGVSNAASLKTGRQSISFNPAFLSDETVSNLKLNIENETSITNYVVKGEVLSLIKHDNTLQNIGNTIELIPDQISMKKKWNHNLCLNVQLRVNGQTKTMTAQNITEKSLQLHSINSVIKSLKK